LKLRKSNAKYLLVFVNNRKVLKSPNAHSALVETKPRQAAAITGAVALHPLFAYGCN
jgi:hypothetical protein